MDTVAVEPPEVRYAKSGDVNIAYQVTGEGAVLVSSTVKDLVAGSGLRFRDRGQRS